MLSRFPSDHPVWPLLHTVTATVCFGALLFVTASNFDGTEVAALSGGGFVTLVVNHLFRPTKGA